VCTTLWTSRIALTDALNPISSDFLKKEPEEPSIDGGKTNQKS
jgi:hypothetical protein